MISSPHRLPKIKQFGANITRTGTCIFVPVFTPKLRKTRDLLSARGDSCLDGQTQRLSVTATTYKAAADVPGRNEH